MEKVRDADCIYVKEEEEEIITEVCRLESDVFVSNLPQLETSKKEKIGIDPESGMAKFPLD
jgi:hypothetical protein